jgi:hypothetical protein
VVGGYADISKVDDRKVRVAHQGCQVATREVEDVIEDIIGRGHLAVAVVPGEIHEVQRVERSLEVASREGRPQTSSTFSPSLVTSDGHVVILSDERDRSRQMSVSSGWPEVSPLAPRALGEDQPCPDLADVQV